MKEKLMQILADYFELSDTYAYNLTRDKRAFAVGTVTVDDFEEFNMDVVADIADHLLANGVVVPPCKVGDTIYRAGDPIKKVYEWQIEHIEIYADEIVFIDDSDNEFTETDFGKTVFLTREEAEAKLKEEVK